jgi:hypothetical protein
MPQSNYCAHYGGTTSAIAAIISLAYQQSSPNVDLVSPNAPERYAECVVIIS